MKTFELPPMLSGTAEEQIDQLREYLMRLALKPDEEEQIPAPVVNTQSEKPSSHGSSFGKAQLAKIYPVGSIYLSVNETDPSSLFGGTWEQIKDTFLLAAGDSYAAGDVGGEATHTLTVEEMPSHVHNETFEPAIGYPRPLGSTVKDADYTSDMAETDPLVKRLTSFPGMTNASATAPVYPLQTLRTGGSQPHNNMPPYLAVYVWQRIA